ncbi:MAG TPA: Uma2 family endonuclease [Planctomycetota bacterium]|nr:Uma2 family endonuclease [Planctomycetota bacterium]
MASTIRTAEELLRAGDIGRCELIRGELVMMVPPGGEHAEVSNEIAHRLTLFVKSRGIGRVLAEAGFVLSRDPDTVRAPDVAFVRAGRVPGRGYMEGAPDLAVEVLSPDDRPGCVREKIGAWLEAGAKAVWIVDPRRRTVTIHEPGSEPLRLGEADTLRGGDVLPGFELPVREVFG